MKIATVSLALAAALLAQAASAATYYVAKTGRDTNAGTLSSPFLTIRKGASVLKPGDRLEVRAGTYAEGLNDAVPSGTSWGSPVTIAAYSGERVVMAPSSGARVFEFSQRGYIVLDGLVLDGRGVTSNVIKITSPAHHIRVKDSEIMNAPAQGILVGTDASYNEFINLKIHNNGSRDLDHGIYINGSNNLVERCDVYANSGTGVQIYTGYAGKRANRNIIRFNKIHGNSTLGRERSSITMTSGEENTAHTNLIWGNGAGIAATNSAIRARIYNNTIYNNAGIGITLTAASGANGGGPSQGADVRNNIVFGNGSAISNAQSGTTVSNNLTSDPLFVAAGSDFHLRSGSPAIDKGANLAAYGVASDFAGSPRPAGAAYDIGAYEYAGVSPTPTPTPEPTPAPTPAPGCVSAAAGTWKNVAVAAQTGSFTASFDATPAAASMDGVVGLSNGPASAYSALAAAVRFNNTGKIDARNGGAYAAAGSISYSPNLSYRFRLVVDVAARKYSAYVRQGAGTEMLIGTGYAFRTEQAGATRLDNLALAAGTGGVTVCAPSVAAAAGTTDTTAPTISAVTAAGLTATGAAISWTTNEPADGQVEYGPTTVYGLSTPLQGAMTTSHSAALSGLTAGTLYHYRVKSKDAAGNLRVSADATFTTAAPAPAAGCVTSASTWINQPLRSLAGTSTVEFDATPSAANIDGVAGLSNGPASAYTALAAAVRFNSTGKIDARSGGAFTASASIPYSAGLTYRFRLVVSLTSRKYSAYVRQGAGAEQLIGSNLSFRSEQSGATALNNLGVFATGGSETVCGTVVK